MKYDINSIGTVIAARRPSCHCLLARQRSQLNAEQMAVYHLQHLRGFVVLCYGCNITYSFMSSYLPVLFQVAVLAPIQTYYL